MSESTGRITAAASVRAIERADVPRVWEMLRGLAEYEKLIEYLSGTPAMLEEALFGTGDRLRGLVAEREARLVGYALYYPAFGSFRAAGDSGSRISTVEPEERGAGTGVALMAELARQVEGRRLLLAGLGSAGLEPPRARLLRAPGCGAVGAGLAGLSPGRPPLDALAKGHPAPR
jgi:L-amino acid N-acyltransferase YncA